MNERTVMLNTLTQDLRLIEQGVEWFEALLAENQFEVLQALRTLHAMPCGRGRPARELSTRQPSVDAYPHGCDQAWAAERAGGKDH
nr:DUF5958 family protein [Streptomyces sp. 3211]